VNASHFSVGFVCRQKPNVLDRALAFYTDAQRFAACRSGGLRKPKLTVKH